MDAWLEHNINMLLQLRPVQSQTVINRKEQRTEFFYRFLLLRISARASSRVDRKTSDDATRSSKNNERRTVTASFIIIIYASAPSKAYWRSSRFQNLDAAQLFGFSLLKPNSFCSNSLTSAIAAQLTSATSTMSEGRMNKPLEEEEKSHECITNSQCLQYVLVLY